jgi:hypothetical protein
MTTSPLDNLDERLASLTTWTGDSPELWKRALNQTRRTSFFDMIARLTPSIIRARPIAASILLLLTGLLVASLASSLGRNHEATQTFAMVVGPEHASYGADYPDRQWKITRDDYGAFVPAAPPVTGRVTDLDGVGATSEQRVFELYADMTNKPDGLINIFASDSGDPANRADSSAPDRAVIRKATLEFTTPDVRAAYFKAVQSLSEARGEFVQSSSLTGEGAAAQAQITLRVAADRLSALLNELRALGKVHVDQTTGEDVTTQAVDLEARLRNEQRVEKELLDLLDKRNDAPLKEVLELRDRIAMIRGSIETLTAQRDRLGKLVSLATILVLIRADEAPAAPVVKEQSFFDYLGASLSSSLKSGSRTLADTLAGFVSLAIGGLLWWILLIATIAVVARIVRRRLAVT